MRGNRTNSLPATRRTFLRTAAAGSAFFTARGAFAEALVLTPEQTIGPYYPDRMPLDRDNDLLVINDSITPAIGDITWVTGKVLDSRGDPVRGATVEIWQADNNGSYIHSASPVRNRDTNFQGYGAFVTGSSGEYLFRTVKPGLYPGRTRHIHYKITYPGGRSITTQLYVQGEALNANDGVLNGIRDTTQRASVVVPFAAVTGSKIGELAAKFDIVLGYTPADASTDGKPAISSASGVVQGASFQPGIAPGAWIAIFGENLAPRARSWNAQTEVVDGKLPTGLDGVSVSINGKAAAVSYISPRQINVQAPSEGLTGSVQVTVTTAAGTSAPATVAVQGALPGFFRFPQEYVAAVRSDGAYIGPVGLIDGVATVPARPADKVAFYGTGFGPSSPVVNAGEVVSSPVVLANAVSIQIDGAPVEVSYAGLTSAGLVQMNVTIPDVADGDHAVTAQVAGVRTQSAARLRVVR
jgi:protocatechuate 3,4-dioxygenase beta subunit